MKFESLLKIYWLKGFYINNKLIKFSETLANFTKTLFGFSFPLLKKLFKRFEIFYLNINYSYNLLLLFRKHKKYLNHFFIQYSPVFCDYKILMQYNILRLYFIKSYRGRCHLLGKPVKGQRTWSNGWTSFYKNTYLKHYLFILNKNKPEQLTSNKNLKNKSILQKKKKKVSLIFKKIKKEKQNKTLSLLKTWL